MIHSCDSMSISPLMISDAISAQIPPRIMQNGFLMVFHFHMKLNMLKIHQIVLSYASVVVHGQRNLLVMKKETLD